TGSTQDSQGPQHRDRGTGLGARGVGRVPVQSLTTGGSMPTCHYACHTADHMVSRRGFLGAASTAAALGPLGFASVSANAALARSQKRVMVIFLSGGLSQLESWDPKPNTDTGGPFKAISTSVPGTWISEL